MAAGLRAGIADKLYRNTGSYGTPTWNEVANAIDVDLGLTKSLAEVKARASTYKKTLAGIKEVTLSFGFLGDTSDADWNVLRDAWAADTVVEFAVADDAIATSGTDYYRAEMHIKEFNYGQKLEEGNTAQVAAELAYTSNALIGWVDVS